MGCFAFALSFAGDVFVFAFGDGGGVAAVGCGERGQHVAFVWQWRGGGVPVGDFGDGEMVGVEPLDAQGAALLRCAPTAFVGLYFGVRGFVAAAVAGDVCAGVGCVCAVVAGLGVCGAGTRFDVDGECDGRPCFSGLCVVWYRHVVRGYGDFDVVY